MPTADFPEPNLPPEAPASPSRRKRRRSDRLPDAAILVVEDEYLVAEELARQIACDGSTVIGPVPTAAAALALIDKTANIGGAVLDVRLGDGTAFPIAVELHKREIPFVFFTAYDDIPWPSDFRAAPKTSKSADWRDLKRILFGPLERCKRQTRDFRDEVAAALPLLRETARAITGNATRGDRLVEKVLEIAVERIDQRGTHASVEAWLMSVLSEASNDPEARLMN